MSSARRRKGTLYGLAAYILWGLLPVYWKTLRTVPALEILCHRMVWSLLFVAILLVVRSRWEWLPHVMGSRRNLITFLGTASLLAVNWFTFIWAVNAGFVLEASLGYYINPLFSIVLGVLFLGERLRLWQGVAIAVAAVGVGYLTWSYGTAPWIALILAGTFSVYGLLRKTAQIESLEGLSLETAILFLPALAYLFHLEADNTATFGHADLRINLLLAAAGVATSLPLLWFAHAARRITLTSLGILQYIGPTLHFLLGVFVYGESFTPARAVAFGATWVALLIYSAEGIIRARRPDAPA